MIVFLNNIQKYFLFYISSAIFGGLVVVYFFGGFEFTPMICLFAAVVMIYPSFVPLAFDKLLLSTKNYQLIIASVVINFIVFPFLAYYIGDIFLEQETVLRLGLLLLALFPGGGMVTTWAMKSNADMPTTVAIVIVNLIIAVVAVPFGVSFFMSHFALNTAQVATESMCIVQKVTNNVASCDFGGQGISPIKIALPILIIVVIPLIFAYITQKIIIKKRSRDYFNENKKKFGEFSNLGLLMVLFVLMSLQSNKIIFDNPTIIIDVFVPLVLFYVIGISIIIFFYKMIDDVRVGKAFVWGSYLRYITLALGIAISLVFQDEQLSIITIVIVLSYFIQIPSSFILMKFLESH